MKIRQVDSGTVITTQPSDTFPNGRYRHAIGGVSVGDTGRRIDHGPMVPGPWAYTFGLGVSICSNPEMGSGAEARRGRAAGTEFAVEDGDLLIFEDVIYQVDTFRGGQYVNLHRMDVRRNVADQKSRMWQYQIDAAAKAKKVS